MAETEKSSQLDAQNPWPGLAAYDEASHAFFNGRDADAEELLRRVQLAPLTVLYGKSGLGKSSLLQAGLFPQLRQKHYLPVYIRLDFSETGSVNFSALDQVATRLKQELEDQKTDFPEFGPSESLWGYLHRRELEIWSPDNYLLTPVLVFDQFEEVFSRGGGDPEQLRLLVHALADLIENRVPAELATGEESRRAAAQLDLFTQRYRVLLSFREDFLPHFKNWEKEIPSLLKNWWQLRLLSRQHAIEVVAKAGVEIVSPGTAEAIVGFVGNLEESRLGNEAAIEPVLLSLFCYQLNRRRQRRDSSQRDPSQRGPSQIDAELLRNAGQDILRDFYNDALADMPSVSRFIEKYLIQGNRYRSSYPVQLAIEERLITQAQLADLTDRHRLLRIDQQLGTPRIELIHDRLVSVVREANERREKEEKEEKEEEERRRARKIFWGSIIVGILVIIVAIGYGVLQRQLAETLNNQKSDFVACVNSATQSITDKSNPDEIANVVAALQACIANSTRNQEKSPTITPSTKYPLIYIQIRDNAQKDCAEYIQNLLQKENFNVSPIQQLNIGPKNTEVRYFKKSSDSQANKIRDILTEMKIKVAYPPKYFSPSDNSNRTPDDHLEIWFAPDAFNNAVGCQK